MVRARIVPHAGGVQIREGKALLPGSYQCKDGCFRGDTPRRCGKFGPIFTTLHIPIQWLRSVANTYTLQASQFKIGMIQLAADPELALSTFHGIVAQLGKNPNCYGFVNEAKILNSIAVAQHELGRTVEAFSGFFKAFKILRKSHSVPAQEALSRTLCNLGYLYAEQKQYSDALFAFNESLAILKKYNLMNDSLVAVLEENLAHVKAYGGTQFEESSPVQKIRQVTEKDKRDHQQSQVFGPCISQSKMLEHGEAVDGEDEKDCETIPAAQSQLWGGCMTPRKPLESDSAQSKIRGSCAMPDRARGRKERRVQSRLSACFIPPGFH